MHHRSIIGSLQAGFKVVVVASSSACGRGGLIAFANGL